jgi:hypothetical protein
MQFRLNRGRALVALFGCVAACGGSSNAADDAGVVSDASSEPDAPAIGDAAPSSDAPPFDPGPEPVVPITPVAGEVTIVQLGLAGALHGEAAIVIGPDGTIALIDIGNSNHDDDVRDAVEELNTVHLTPANGFAARAPLQVEWLIATHFHGDHIGAFEDLLIDTAEPLQITEGIVHRGFVDLGAGMNTGDYETICAAMRGMYLQVDTPLCETASAPTCVYGDLVDAHRATGCPGLHVGDLSEPADDSDGEPTYIDLGSGARITLVAANNFVSNGNNPVEGAQFGHDDNNHENARSMAGVITHGRFSYHFGGDMTGEGTATEPDVETHLATNSGPAFYGSLGVDVAHIHHHVRNPSSNATIVDVLAPNDGLSRNAVGGISPIHVNSPHQETLDVWGNDDRLGDGYIWLTAIATGGDSHAAMLDADGPVIVQTIQAGLGYRVQDAGDTLFSAPYRSVRY